VAIRDWLAAEGWDDVFLDFDPERGIKAGLRWERALNEAASRCEAVLFLVSRAWLDTRWWETKSPRIWSRWAWISKQATATGTSAAKMRAAAALVDAAWRIAIRCGTWSGPARQVATTRATAVESMHRHVRWFL
jgi:hypothetical protein